MSELEKLIEEIAGPRASCNCPHCLGNPCVATCSYSATLTRLRGLLTPERIARLAADEMNEFERDVTLLWVKVSGGGERPVPFFAAMVEGAEDVDH